jgi:hypothetical protein
VQYKFMANYYSASAPTPSSSVVVVDGTDVMLTMTSGNSATVGGTYESPAYPIKSVYTPHRLCLCLCTAFELRASPLDSTQLFWFVQCHFAVRFVLLPLWLRAVRCPLCLSLTVCVGADHEWSVRDLPLPAATRTAASSPQPVWARARKTLSPTVSLPPLVCARAGRTECECDGCAARFGCAAGGVANGGSALFAVAMSAVLFCATLVVSSL